MIGKKEEYTADYLVKLLSCCDPEAYVNIIVRHGDNEIITPITSLLIHQTEDKKELISFVYDQGDMINDL